ncbi:MAG: response regulator [Rhodospirillales bacterium]
MIVDDDKEFRVALMDLLNEEGHTTLGLFDGQGIKDVIVDFQPDVVMTDVMMANRDGVETVREIREFDDDLYVIGMSGNAFYLQMLLKLGANAVLVKPFQVRQVRQCFAEAEKRNIGRNRRSPMLKK